LRPEKRDPGLAKWFKELGKLIRGQKKIWVWENWSRVGKTSSGDGNKPRLGGSGKTVPGLGGKIVPELGISRGSANESRDGKVIGGWKNGSSSEKTDPGQGKRILG
jgi:hypothetical protein